MSYQMLIVKVAPLGGEVKEFRLDPNENPTVKDVLDLAEIDEIEEESLFVNGEPAKMEKQLRNGDIIAVVPKIGGGC